MSPSPTTIDLSRLPAPDAIETLNAEAFIAAFFDRFLVSWNAAREIDPSLPPYDVEALKANPAARFAHVFAYLRLLDRARVNDAIKALLAPLSTGTNLENLVARQGIVRLVVTPATANTAAVMETDTALLRRYLLSFERPSAGSTNRYLYEAWTAWPSMLDAKINGYAVHGRRGDTDVVVIGPDGRAATVEEKAIVRAAVTHPSVQPEAVAVAVVDAVRREYSVAVALHVPPGPDAELIRQEAVARIRAAGDARMLIGGEVLPGYIIGSAYGANVIRVINIAVEAIEPHPYTVPILTDIDVTVEVRT